jgi:hypothetical protein
MKPPVSGVLSLVQQGLVAGALLGLGGCGGTTRQPATNKVVILVDASGSYAKRLPDAVRRATTLVEGLAQAKTERWEKAVDEISIVSIDAIPDVLWHGSLRELQGLDAGFWKVRLDGRGDYNRCTDVTAAFNLAAQQLEGDSRFVSKYLFAFTDLIHEPPTDSVERCKTPRLPSGPADEFPWELLSDVSVSVFWLPPSQALTWKRAVQERGLSQSFRFYTTSESANAPIPTPPRPRVKKSDAEKTDDRERVLGRLGNAGKLGLQVAALALVVAILLPWLASRRRRARRARRLGRPQREATRRPLNRGLRPRAAAAGQGGLT